MVFPVLCHLVAICYIVAAYPVSPEAPVWGSVVVARPFMFPLGLVTLLALLLLGTTIVWRDKKAKRAIVVLWLAVCLPCWALSHFVLGLGILMSM
jgi:cytochrome c biogenesis factor